MSDQSTLSALVAAWEARLFAPWDEYLAERFETALSAFCGDHALKPQFVRSEMLRLRQHRPVPDLAAVLVAIIEGTDQ